MSRRSAVFLCTAIMLCFCSDTAYGCGWSPSFKPDVTDDVWKALHEHWKDIPANWKELVRGKDVRQIRQLLREHNLPENIATVVQQFRDSDSAEKFRASLINVHRATSIRETHVRQSRYPSDTIRGSVSRSSISESASLPVKTVSTQFRLRESGGRISRYARSVNIYAKLHNLYKRKLENGLHKP